MSVGNSLKLSNGDDHIQQNIKKLILIEETAVGRHEEVNSLFSTYEKVLLIKPYYVLLVCQLINNNNTPWEMS